MLIERVFIHAQANSIRRNDFSGSACISSASPCDALARGIRPRSRVSAVGRFCGSRGFPRPSSLYCGDGADDPSSEECEDDVSAELDSCTSDCQTRDFLAVPAAPGGSSLAGEKSTDATDLSQSLALLGEGSLRSRAFASGVFPTIGTQLQYDVKFAFAAAGGGGNLQVPPIEAKGTTHHFSSAQSVESWTTTEPVLGDAAVQRQRRGPRSCPQGIQVENGHSWAGVEMKKVKRVYL